MNDFIEQIKSVVKIVEEICIDLEKNSNFQLIPELMDLLETILPNIFNYNNTMKVFDQELIIEILNDIVNAYENNDIILMTDVLRHGLISNLNQFTEALKANEGI